MIIYQLVIMYQLIMIIYQLTTVIMYQLISVVDKSLAQFAISVYIRGA